MDPEIHDPLVIHAAVHPSAPVERFGFPLDHPYVDQCLLPLLGPSSVTVLQRLPDLWKLAHPFETTFRDFGQALGLRPHNLARTFQRMTKFGFAAQPAPGSLDVYARCAPLTDRMLARVPPWLQATHHRMLDDHLAELTRKMDGPEIRRSAGTKPAPAHEGPASFELTTQLERLRQKAATRSAQVLGR